MVGVLAAAPAGAWDRRDVDVLAVLPDVPPGVQSSVEGLAVGPRSELRLQHEGRSPATPCSS